MSFLDIRENNNFSAGFFINSPFDFPGQVAIIDPYSSYTQSNWNSPGGHMVIKGVDRTPHPNMYLTGYLPHVHSGCAPFDGGMECCYDVFDCGSSGATGSLFLGRIGGSCGAIAVFVETVSGRLFGKQEVGGTYGDNRGPDRGNLATVDLPFARNTDPCPPGSSEATIFDAVENYHYAPFQRVVIWPDGDYSIKRVPYHIKPVLSSNESAVKSWNDASSASTPEAWFEFSIRVTAWFPSGGAHGPPKNNCEITHGEFMTGWGFCHSGEATAGSTYGATAFSKLAAGGTVQVGYGKHFADPIRTLTKARGIYPSAIGAGPQGSHVGRIKQSGANGATGVSLPITNPSAANYGKAYWTGYAFSGAQILPSWHRNAGAHFSDLNGINWGGTTAAMTANGSGENIRKSTGGHGHAMIRVIVEPAGPSDDGGDGEGGGS